MSRILRPDAHIRADARALMEEAEEEGVIGGKRMRQARILDDSAYEIDWADEKAEEILEKRGNRKTPPPDKT